MKVTITVDDAGSEASAVRLSSESTPETSTTSSSAGGVSAGPAPADPGAPTGATMATGADVGAFDPARAAGDAISAGPAPEE